MFSTLLPEKSHILDEYYFQNNYNEGYTVDYQNAEYIYESLPENIAERLSHIKMDTYDTIVKNGLLSKDNDYTDHGNGLITYKECIYIPPNHSLRTDIIKEHHDSTSAGHPGRYKTQELITRDYWWPRIQGQIRHYIDGCKPCQRTKVHRDKPHNPLHPHAIPTTPWEHISIDLIGLLPESNGFNAILVIIDQFSKMIILIATTTELTSTKTAEYYRDYVWSKHGLPRKVISDRGTQFVAQFMKDLHTLVGVKQTPLLHITLRPTDKWSI